MDPLLLLALALLTAFVLGRASARATWRRIHAERNDMAAYEVLAQRWRQTAAPVPEWSEGELNLRAQVEAEVAKQGPPPRADRFVARHRRYAWVGFWAASVTPRDPQARIAAALAACPALPSPGAGQKALESIAAESATSHGRLRELVGVA